MRSRSMRSPRSDRIAGSRVRALATVTIPTSTAPVAKLRSTVSGTSSMPSSATTNAEPENSTALLAVAPETAIESCFARPAYRSSR